MHQITSSNRGMGPLKAMCGQSRHDYNMACARTATLTSVFIKDEYVQIITKQFSTEAPAKHTAINKRSWLQASSRRKAFCKNSVAKLSPVDWGSHLALADCSDNGIWLQINRCNQVLSYWKKKRGRGMKSSSIKWLQVCSKAEARFQEIKIGILNTNPSRWSGSHMQRCMLSNGREEHRSPRGHIAKQTSHWWIGVWDSLHSCCRLWQQSTSLSLMRSASLWNVLVYLWCC